MRLQSFFIAALLLVSSTVFAQNKITAHTDSAKTKINRDIYGHFAEHLGRCIYDGFYVGDTSLIDNIKGFRVDVIDALQEMNIPLLRWPGGCFADTYNWKDGVGSKKIRPSIVNVHWGGVTEDNSFGTHEFMDFCELIGAEAYINLNVGSGSVREAKEWVEYMTSPNKSPMTEWRKENGRDEPWKVKYWGIGNENWGCGGNMTPEYYADLYRNYATYCHGADYKIAGGANVADYNWTEVMMKKLVHHKHIVDGLSLHYYVHPGGWSNKGSATEFDEAEYHLTLQKALYMEELINNHSAIMDKYDPNKEIDMIVDEWGSWYDVEPGTNPGFLFQQNTLRDALCAGMQLNMFNNHADRIKMANIAQMVNVIQAVILTKGETMVLTPTYYVFKMYSVHQDATLVPLSIECDDYEVGGEKLPVLHASASTKDGKLNLTVCNLDPNNDVEFEYDILGEKYTKASGQIIGGEKINSLNEFGKEEEVTLKQFSLKQPKKGKLKLKIPAKSVVLISLEK
ncbi:alpha-N-arabinofuranosidase [Carboxylicivirga sp. N1Y90]|uniref:alpha-N-arabinofuranosidase n=1 Tax=Carboxylicivirga fragile TaxID=3417571 RepID=UPI003D347E70|nr:alpha-N-arabinofuranosidase [Marinilabiliaceae bacterium N1Y90]